MFYVHEVTGTIVQRDSKPGWFWKGGYETEFQARSVSYDISKNSRDPFRAIYLFAKFFIFIAFILIVLLVKCIRMAFPKRGAKVSIATRIIGIVGSIIIISGYAIGGNYIYKYFFAPTGYVVTKCEILEYENKVSEPKDKEIGKIPDIEAQSRIGRIRCDHFCGGQQDKRDAQPLIGAVEDVRQ